MNFPCKEVEDYYKKNFVNGRNPITGQRLTKEVIEEFALVCGCPLHLDLGFIKGICTQCNKEYREERPEGFYEFKCPLCGNIDGCIGKKEEVDSWWEKRAKSE